MPSPRTPARLAQTFEDLYESVEDDERAFFDLLDRELDKVESFFGARESEAVARADELKVQLTKLSEHRKMYHQVHPEGLAGMFLPAQKAIILSKAADRLRLRVPFIDDHEHDSGQPKNNDVNTPVNERQRPAGPSRLNSNSAGGASNGDITPGEYQTYSPERYQHYKRELRAATMDFYRHLERIKNYRILNLTGFRKALKKFEKTTRIHCMDMFTDERISKQSFAKGEVVENLINQAENLFSEHFGES